MRMNELEIQLSELARWFRTHAEEKRAREIEEQTRNFLEQIHRFGPTERRQISESAEAFLFSSLALKFEIEAHAFPKKEAV